MDGRPAVTGGSRPELKAAEEQRAALGRNTFRPVAERLAARLHPTLARFKPNRALTEKAEWFVDSDDGLVVVVAGKHEAPDVSDEILAYALAWQGDRDIVLILPEKHVGLTLARLPWIATPVRLFTYGPDLEPRPAIIPTRAEVLDDAAQRPLRPHGASRSG